MLNIFSVLYDVIACTPGGVLFLALSISPTLGNGPIMSLIQSAANCKANDDCVMYVVMLPKVKVFILETDK